MSTVTIEVNGRSVEAEAGATILSALKRAGVRVPTLCHIDGLAPTGACRLCVVEVEGQRNLIPSCAFPVADGMKIRTHSPRAIRARKTIIELLLADHPDDCNYCVRNGECQLQELAQELGVRLHRYGDYEKGWHLDKSSPSLVRDPGKCILCGRCVRVCEEVQNVSAIDFIGRGSKAHVGTAFDQGLNVSTCITCGQCIMACPTAALHEQSHLKQVMDALVDESAYAVVQVAPAVSVTLAEEFDLPAGTDVAGALNAALRRLGFQRVFETSFSADLTIMEEASELAARIKQGGKLPMMTSCSPGWIKFVEQFYPEYVDNLSTCKSPQQMLGAVIKSYFAQQEQLDAHHIFSVAVMPCVAKKFEAGRPEMLHDGIADVDAVLTTRELARMIRLFGLDLREIAPETPDTPFGERSTAGKLFGGTGGVMEAALRTAHYLLTGAELGELEVAAVRGLSGAKETVVNIGGAPLGVAVVSGLANARKLLEQIRDGRDDLHFIEVMTCPGGCINGGGQPIGTNLEHVKARMQALYSIDATETVRVSHHNAAVKRLYDEFLGAPLSQRSHELLHTHYNRQRLVV
jgi:iron-only hydrogenase group A